MGKCWLFQLINLWNKVVGNITVTSKKQSSFLTHIFPTIKAKNVPYICKAIHQIFSEWRITGACVCASVCVCMCACNFQRWIKWHCWNKGNKILLSTPSCSHFLKENKLPDHGKISHRHFLFFPFSVPSHTPLMPVIIIHGLMGIWGDSIISVIL